MAANNLTITMENDTIEDHLVTLFEKLETIRETKEATNALTKRYRQPIRIEIRALEFWRSIISECLASFFFIFIVSGAYFNALKKGMDSAWNDTVVPTALASGLAMTILNQCFGKISGGHVNPAVSLAMAATKKITPLRAAMYVIAQCGGGIAGAALLYGVTPGPHPIIPPQNIGSWERFGIELVLTFIVVFTYCTAADRKLFSNGSIVIGAAYGACSLVSMPMLNPARALGPVFVWNKLWENHWVFWFGPVAGGVLAAVIYEFIFNSRRHAKRPKDSIDGDSSSIRSEDEPFEDSKYVSAYRPVAPDNPLSPGGAYCPSLASGSVFSTPAAKLDRGNLLYGNRFGKQQSNTDEIYSGSRSLCNAKMSDEVFTKSPPLTRANLSRSQSVIDKARNPRDILPKPGPLIPAYSDYHLKGGHLNANIRDFGGPNFITGVKTFEGNVIKVPQVNGANGPTFNQNTLNFLAGRNGLKSSHDIPETCERTNFIQQPSVFNGNHVTNQNVQNQHLQSLKPEKSAVENIYGIRNSPTGGIYPGNEPRRPEIPGKRDNYELIPRSHDKRSETPRSQNSTFSRTADYVRSVQNNPGYKPRESNYDIVPSGIREVPNFNPKPHNRSETSDYGSNRSDTSIYGINRSLELGNRPEAEQNETRADNRPENGPESRPHMKRSEKLSSEAKKHDRPELPLPNKEIETENRSSSSQKSSFPSGSPQSFNQNGPVSQQYHQQQIALRHLHLSHNKPMMPEPGCNGMPTVNPQLGMNFLNQRQESRQSPLSSVSSSSFSRNSPNPPY